jgi:hypothetical protein
MDVKHFSCLKVTPDGSKVVILDLELNTLNSGLLVGHTII